MDYPDKVEPSGSVIFKCANCKKYVFIMEYDIASMTLLFTCKECRCKHRLFIENIYGYREALQEMALYDLHDKG